MLSHIDIQNFAIIKDLNVDFNQGLNVITGETGAGKSIIIEAVSMALGSRADTDYIRTGSEKASITLTVDTDDVEIEDLLSEAGLETDNPMVLHREINQNGKSLCRINGSIVPLSSMSRICKRIADIHGQYDHQNLLNPENHIAVLDAYGGSAIADVKRIVMSVYDEYSKASAQLTQLKKSLTDAERKKDLLRFEISEIENANLLPGEDDQLEEEIRIMNNAEKISSALSSAREDLFLSDNSAITNLGNAMSSLQQISSFSKEIETASSSVSDLFYQLDDLNSSLRKLADGIDYSQDRLNSNIERLDAINALKRKFSGSIEKVLEYADNAKQELSVIENCDEQLARLERDIALHAEEYDVASKRLTVLRKDAASKLEKQVTGELSELNFKNAVFSVSISPAPMSANGSDSIEFLISANLGESLRPLAKVASGGELSRIMLALKRIIGDSDRIPTMIFDEIDTGISGATAGVVGTKLKSISKSHQIICITHLPQIACLGDHHYMIQKTSDSTSTSTTLVKLDENEKVEEIARLLSGEEITDTARAQAKELINGKH